MQSKVNLNKNSCVSLETKKSLQKKNDRGAVAILDADNLGSQGTSELRWLRPLEETNDFIVPVLNLVFPAKSTKQLSSDIHCFQEKLAIAHVKEYDSELRLQETLEYLSILECSIIKAANIVLSPVKMLGLT